jgi:hypothetical protein
MRDRDRLVEDFKDFSEMQSKVAAVRVRVLDDVGDEVVMLENASVVGKKAEEQTDKVHLQLMSAILYIFEPVVEASHLFRRFDIDRVQFLELDFGIACQITEHFNAAGKDGKGETVELAVLLKVVIFKGDEITNRNTLGH